MSYLIDLLPHQVFLQVFRVFNLVVALFGALMMMFSMRTETSTKENNWTKYLGIALSLFVVQYVVYAANIQELTESIAGTKDNNAFIWSELFSVPINWFLLSSAMTLLNRRPRLPRWFFVLIAADLIVVIFMMLGLLGGKPTELILTLCRILGDSISFISLMYFGYASYINTNFYKSHFGIVLWIAIGIIYGGIHLIAPFTPNIAAHYAPTTLEAGIIGKRITAALTFAAALLKLFILFSVYKITALENQTLINLRDKLRESVVDRKVFFSREGILKAIYQAFGADEVKLYIKVPFVGEAQTHRQVHKYWSPSEAPSEYEVVSESETPLPALLDQLLTAQAEVERRKTEHPGGSRLNKIFRAAFAQSTRARFDGLEPIRYHGALIGCLKIEKNELWNFTYSAEKLFQILSEDISVLVQFYRLNESLRVLNEGLNKSLKTPRTREKEQDLAALSSADLDQQFEDVLQQVLCPLRTRFLIDTGFRNTAGLETVDELSASARANGRKPVNYECYTDEANGRLTIGHIHLQYQKERDPLGNPSLGYFHTYGESVASIVTRFFLSAIEQKLDLIIQNLSATLTRPMTFDIWLNEIEKSVEAAELDGVVVYAPEVLEFRQVVRAEDAPNNQAVGAALAEAFPELLKVLENLEAARPKVITSEGERLVIGMRLPHRDAGIFVGVRRKEFARELSLSPPWCGFLVSLAGVAGNTLDRIITARDMQKKQIERAEDYMVILMAEKVGLLTHELINRIENLASNAALINLDVTSLELDAAMKRPVELRIEELRSEFDQLRSLAAGIRNAAQIPEESSPCFLMKTLCQIAKLHETRSHIKIEVTEGVRIRSQPPASPRTLPDVKVALPAFIVEQTFGNLIRNSIAAIKRKANDGGNGADGFNRQDVIRIWAEVENGEKFVNCFINDTGTGVEPNIREAIFDINVTTTPGKGGWGLFYVKRKLKDSGGSIQLEHSERGDTTFRVSLPKFSQ
jgi:signal transduction histidine kinase